MRILFGYQDTRSNSEDFALTPYLFTVFVTGKVTRIYGIGICWAYSSFYLGFGFNVPKYYPTFTHIPREGKR
jgi:hypothetical protein